MAILARLFRVARHAGGVLHTGHEFVLGDEIRPVMFLRAQGHKVRVAGFTIIGDSQVVVAGRAGGHCRETFFRGQAH